MKPTLNVVEFVPPEIRDPIQMLRTIADEMEDGQYGHVGTLGVVFFSDQMEVFAAGEDSNDASIAMLFHAAILRLAQAIESHGR